MSCNTKPLVLWLALASFTFEPMNEIPYEVAVRLLFNYSQANSPNSLEDGEILANVTHWLANQSEKPVYGTLEDSSEWTRLLTAHGNSSILNQWNGEPLRPKPPKAYRITGSSGRLRARSKFRFIELFAGIGGFRLALESLGGKCVFASEWDNACRQTYFRNFREYPFGDVRRFSNDSLSDQQLEKIIPDHDILTAGFPCQPFSTAGLPSRKHYDYESGFECVDQGNLFYDILRIAKVKRPAVLLLENVKNIVTHDSKRTFAEIRRQIEDNLNYSFSHKVIDASGVVPQKRERCYIVCFRDKDIVFDFPKFPSKALPLNTILEPNPDAKYTISDKLWIGHKNRSKRNRERKTGFVAVTADPEKPANTLMARYGKDGKECLIPQEGKNPRMLTPREAARLQGFPESFKLYENGARPYKQLGNSVVVPLVKRIGAKILRDYLLKKVEN